MEMARSDTPKTVRPQPLADAIPVSRTALPLSCPRPDDALWNMHPRIYLPIEREPSREATCPYCGARYRLQD